MRYLGLDVGTKTLGVALSDEMGWLAQALTTIRRTTLRRDLDALALLLQQHDVGAFVVGIPYDAEGELGEQALWVEGFIERLQERFPTIPIHRFDERFSTYAAEQTLIEAKVRREKRKAVIDKIAATWILQGFLDSEIRAQAPR